MAEMPHTPEPSIRIFCWLPVELLTYILFKCDDRSLDIFFLQIVPPLLSDPDDWRAHQLIKNVGLACFNRHHGWRMRGKSRIRVLYDRLRGDSWCAFCDKKLKIVSVEPPFSEQLDFFPLNMCLSCLEYGPPDGSTWENMRVIRIDELKRRLGWVSHNLLCRVLPVVKVWAGTRWDSIFIVQRYGQSFLKGLDIDSVAEHVALLCLANR